ncbi:MAG TPA: hypothetical protein VFA07_15340 [Chthonomonadaceae bacterium]|nr:hypothetical protein [Chthonomonadaceae bacterium]
MQQPANTDSDVLPPPVNRILALLWILLFGGRWIIVTWLLAAGVLKREQVAAWDDGILLRCYLILLVITLVVAALRAVRATRPAVPAAQPGSPSSQAGLSEPASQVGATAVGNADSRRSAKSGAGRRRVQGRD